MSSTPRKPSSSNDGFFQQLPTIPNQFYDDVSFQRIVKLFLPKSIVNAVTPDLAQFGEEVLSKRILDWVTDAERNEPYVRGGGRDAFGRRTSELVVSEGWKNLQNFGIEHGIVAAGYEGKHSASSRVVQFLKTHLWTGSCANVSCPSAMTDGAAKLLGAHLSSTQLDSVTRRVFQDAYDRLTSRDPKNAWTSGQWMTERTGGSDVSGTETIATLSRTPENASTSEIPLGPWHIDGFKWFSSATDSSMTVLLAQTPKGLSTFFAPMRKPSGTTEGESELKGIFIQRLKNKSGTKSLPTAELELCGTRAYLIGKEGQGIQEISSILNITRLYSAVGAVGSVGRGLAIAKSFALVREIGAGKGKRLMLRDSSLHMNTLAKVTGEYHSMMLFNFFVASLLGISEHSSTTKSSESSESRARLQPDIIGDVPLLLRILTPVMKGAVCKRAIYALQECMEALGGVGYLDNSENEAINIARLYRDCCVNSIWEGTTDVLASDTLRVLKGRLGEQVLNALDRWVSKALKRNSRGDSQLENAKNDISFAWTTLKGKFKEGSQESLLPFARDLLFNIADTVMSILLIVDTEYDMSDAASEMCFRYLKEHGVIKNDMEAGIKDLGGRLGMNQKIVYGDAAGELSTTQSKASKL